MICAWLFLQVAERRLPHVPRRIEIALYSVLTAGVVVSLVLPTVAVLEILRPLLAILLVYRVIYTRGEDWRVLDSPTAYQSSRTFNTAFLVMFTVLSATLFTEYVLWFAAGQPTPGSDNTTPGTLLDWISVLRAGPVEELISAGLVTGLMYARRPAWEMYAGAILIRLAIHLRFGMPMALCVIILAAGSVYLYRRYRTVAPLILAHLIWDVAMTIKLSV